MINKSQDLWRISGLSQGPKGNLSFEYQDWPVMKCMLSPWKRCNIDRDDSLWPRAISRKWFNFEPQEYQIWSINHSLLTPVQGNSFPILITPFNFVPNCIGDMYNQVKKIFLNFHCLECFISKMAVGFYQNIFSTLWR